MIDLKEEARTRLRALVEAEGPEFLADPARLRGIMADRLPTFRREVAVLNAALEAGIPQRLRARDETQVPAALVAELAAEVAATTKTSPQPVSVDEARWGVNAWAFALGLDDALPVGPGGRVDPDRSTDIKDAAAASGLRVSNRALMAIAGVAVVVLVLVIANLAGGTDSPRASSVAEVTAGPVATPTPDEEPTPDPTPTPEDEPTPTPEPTPEPTPTPDAASLTDQMIQLTGSKVSDCQPTDLFGAETAAISCSVEGADQVRYGTYAEDFDNLTSPALDALRSTFAETAESHDLLIQPSGKCANNIAGEGPWVFTGSDDEAGRQMCYYEFSDDGTYIGARIDWTDERYAVWATVWSAELDIAGLHAVWKEGISLTR